MEDKKENLETIESPNQLANLEAPQRAQLLKELPKKQKEKVVNNLIETAMVMGLMDPYEIRLWLGLRKYNIKTMRATVNNIKQRWLDESDDIVEYARTQRAVQIKRAWDNIRKCEKMFDDAKSTGDKVKVKQLELQYMQYIAKLSFIDQMIEETTPGVQVNLIAGSKVADEH
jgi:molecular chaperone GrpE (heat shock protein)